MTEPLPSINISLRNSQQNPPIRSARTPRSVDHLRKTQQPLLSQPLTYAERFHYTTKTSNYEQMSDQMIWREYEKLRDCLKTLNEEILAEMEKRAVVMRRNEPPRTKPQQEQMRLLEEEKQMNEGIIKNKKEDLVSTEGRVKILTKQGIREELEIECEKVIEQITKMKVENKDYRRKSKLLERDLQTAPQLLLDKLLNLEEEMVIWDRKIFKQRRKIAESDKAMDEAIERFNQLTKAITSRQEQYKAVERYVVEEIQLDNYQQLKTKRDNLKKQESVFKRNYLLKLKDLDSLVTGINQHDKVITQTQKNIITIRTQIQSIGAILGARRPSVTQQKHYQKPLKYQQPAEDRKSSKRHVSMMQIRETANDDKNDPSQQATTNISS